MHAPATPLDDRLADQILSATRTAIGDSLRSVVFFTPTDHEILYLRSDIAANDSERVDRIKAQFVENERLGFRSDETYNETLAAPGVEPDIGRYEFTTRVFSDGFVNRIIVGERGLIVTTDGLDVDAFGELSVTLRKLLAE